MINPELLSVKAYDSLRLWVYHWALLWGPQERQQERDPRSAFLLLRNFGHVIMASTESSATLWVGLNGVRIPALLNFVLLLTSLKPQIISHPLEHKYYKRACNPWGLICVSVALLTDQSLGTGNLSNLGELETNQNTCLILFKFHGLRRVTGRTNTISVIALVFHGLVAA